MLGRVMTPAANLVVRAALLFSVVPALACGGGESQPAVCFGANVIANEKNNYSFSSTIDLPSVTVAHMSNLAFDWGALTQDFLGHPLDPTRDLGSAIVMLWGLPLADLEVKLNADALFTSDLIVSPPLSLRLDGATAANLHQFQINETPVTAEMFNAFFDANLYPRETASFLVAVQTGYELGREIRMLQAFELSATSSTTNVALTNSSTKLSYSANLHDLTITGVPGGTPALTLDWSQLTTNALGAPFGEGAITSAIVGHYAESPAELESKFLDLDRIAMETYRADIAAGAVLDFTTLRDAKGAPFPGTNATGTWLVGLICGNCRNPAPWYMTILRPCAQ
jgi:hypothetical protein